MLTANRRRWMRDYMREYRQGELRGDGVEKSPPLERSEALRASHRFHSYKWGFSKLLGPRYEILLCAQYGPEYGVFKVQDGMITGYDYGFINDWKRVIRYFSILKLFKRACYLGVYELFKVFLFRKYNQKFNQVTDYVVGVLDKGVLLENLQKLKGQDSSIWGEVLTKVEREAGRKAWYEFDPPREPTLWVGRYTECYVFKWTARGRPRWDSSALRNSLYTWALGTCRISLRGGYERLRVGIPFPKQLSVSPALVINESA